MAQGEGKGWGRGLNGRENKQQRSIRCAADATISKYAQRLSAIPPFVQMKAHSSVIFLIQCQRHATHATMVGLHSVPNAFQVREDDIGPCMNQEPPPSSRRTYT